jgi:hypothetical protein
VPHTLARTTAEDVIGATDATLLRAEGATADYVSSFLDIPPENAANALRMAGELKLLQEGDTGTYRPLFPFAVYLVTSAVDHRAAILRLVLEQYPPYKLFKKRLALTGSLDTAANETRAVYGLSAHRGEIISTFVSLGTYTNSIATEGAGRYLVAVREIPEFLNLMNAVIQGREATEVHVRNRLGPEASEWIDATEVLAPLVTAVQRLEVAVNDPRSPVLYAGNAIESFLTSVAQAKGVNVGQAHGINAKADRLAADGALLKKHLNMLKYLGHVRNAADHGTDQEINQTWEVSESTSVEYVHVSISVVRNVVAALNGRYFV